MPASWLLAPWQAYRPARRCQAQRGPPRWRQAQPRWRQRSVPGRQQRAPWWPRTGPGTGRKAAHPRSSRHRQAYPSKRGQAAKAVATSLHFRLSPTHQPRRPTAPKPCRRWPPERPQPSSGPGTASHSRCRPMHRKATPALRLPGLVVRLRTAQRAVAWGGPLLCWPGCRCQPNQVRRRGQAGWPMPRRPMARTRTPAPQVLQAVYRRSLDMAGQRRHRLPATWPSQGSSTRAAQQCRPPARPGTSLGQPTPQPHQGQPRPALPRLVPQGRWPAC